MPEDVVIVTGGTQGLGQGIALHLAATGTTGLVICGRSTRRGEDTAAEIGKLGCSCLYVPADLSQEADCRRVVHAARQRFETVSGLVNAAGLTSRGTVEDTSVELWDLLFSVNVRAPFILIQETVRWMKATARGGSIVNIISDCCHGGYPFLTAYSASKGALATLTKNVAHALRGDRIRVNGICLGWMYTPNEHRIQLAAGQPQDWLQRVEAAKPFGRLIRPQDVAHLVSYLLGDRSAMMTGALIDFDQKVVGGLD